MPGRLGKAGPELVAAVALSDVEERFFGEFFEPEGPIRLPILSDRTACAIRLADWSRPLIIYLQRHRPSEITVQDRGLHDSERSKFHHHEN